MGTGKIELAEAQALAESVLGHITPAMARIAVAGSIRRQKPIVGDIEVVGIPADRERLLQLLSDIGQHIKPSVPGVVPWTPKVDAKYLRLRLPQGVNLDVFLATPRNWGGIYLMRTGSAAGSDGTAQSGFVPGCFSRWKRISEGGRMTDCMPTTAAGEQIAVPEEEDFFSLIRMRPVPPEERVSRGAIKRYAID